MNARENEQLDPVCGMVVSPEKAAATIRQSSRTWLFCSTHCRDRFAADPGSFIDGKSPPAIAAHPEAVYVCPMHPEVTAQKPGPCSICGMALEPMTPILENGPDPELIDMRRRFVIQAIRQQDRTCRSSGCYQKIRPAKP